ncbi:hypothetical protein FACS18949_09600 [Clostridia bacterium]|nr:hypothetical protein FACS18949_09600 [Clostridia bacterium]
MRPEDNDTSAAGGKDFSLDSIMSEFGYDSVVKRKKPATPAETARMAAETEKILAELNEERIPAKPPSAKEPKNVKAGEILSAEIDFSASDEFQAMFTQASDDIKRDARREAQREERERRDEPREPRERKEKKPPPVLASDTAPIRAVRAKPEVKPSDAARRITPYARSVTLRLLIALAMNVPLLYITFSHRIGLPLPEGVQFLYHPYTYTFVVFLFQALIMVCASDVLARGCFDMFKLRPSMETGVAAACLASTLHVFSIFIFGGSWGAYLPYCAVSATSATVALWGARTKFAARLRTYTIAENANQSVTTELRLYTDVDGITKRRVPPEGIVAQTEKRDSVQSMFGLFIPIALVLSLILAFIASFGQDRGKDFFWALSAILSCVTPVCALMSFNLPYSIVSKRLAVMGAAIAGWSAARQLSRADSIVLTDLDLFTAGTITAASWKTQDSRALSYAASMLNASGSGLAQTFLPMLEEKSLNLLEVSEFRPTEAHRTPERGMSGRIDGDKVLVGGSRFLIAEGVIVPQSQMNLTGVFVAINKELAGVFVLNYEPPKSVKKALKMFLLKNFQLIFATRDFNLTQETLKQHFSLTDENIEYPVIEERLKLSGTSRQVTAKTVAAISKEGALPYAECVLGAMSLRRIVSVNLLLSVLCAVIGTALMFYLVVTGSASGVSPVNILLFQWIGLGVVCLCSGWAAQY